MGRVKDDTKVSTVGDVGSEAFRRLMTGGTSRRFMRSGDAALDFKNI